jgi:hypothetical protein
LAVLTNLEFGDEDVAGVDGHCLAAGLLSHQAIDVDAELPAVDSDDLPNLSLFDAADNDDFVGFADWDTSG